MFEKREAYVTTWPRICLGNDHMYLKRLLGPVFCSYIVLIFPNDRSSFQINKLGS